MAKKKVKAEPLPVQRQLNNCPICSGVCSVRYKLELPRLQVEHLGWFSESDLYWVQCESSWCGLRGPIASSRESSARAWRLMCRAFGNQVQQALEDAVEDEVT